MTEIKKIKVGVIGCGQVAQIEWLPYMHELDEYEITALCDISEKLVNYYGDLYGVQKRYTDWKKLLKLEELDGIVILTSNHLEICLEAARRGVHVLVEKPLCENPQQARQIEKAVQDSGIILMVGEMKRYDPGYLYAQELIRNMKGLRMIRARDFCDGLSSSQPEIYQSRRRTDVPQNVKDALEHSFQEGMRQVTKDMPVQLYYRLLLAGVHDVDIMRAAFGEPIGVVHCDIWDDGNILAAELDYGEKVKAFFEIGYTHQKWFEEELTAYGEEQTIRVCFPHPYLKNCPTVVRIVENDNGTIVEKKISASYEESFRNELLHFHECVTQKKTPRTSVEEGRKDIELLAKIYECYAERVREQG